jgi:hypothetical protein
MIYVLAGRESESKAASRRFALWLLRESLLSWLLIGGPTQDLQPLSWVIHVLRHSVESIIRASTCGSGWVEETGLCEAVIQEVRLLVGHVMDRSPGSIADLAAILGQSYPAGSKPGQEGGGPERKMVEEGPSRQSGGKELRTHLLSVGSVDRDGEVGSPVRGHGNGRGVIGSVVLGRCAQGFSGLVKRGLVKGGAVDLLVRLILHLQQAQPQEALLCQSVACLVELMAGCLEAKRHLATVMGYSNMPSLLPVTLPPLLRFHILTEASTTERLLPCLPPFTALALVPSPSIEPAFLDGEKMDNPLERGDSLPSSTSTSLPSSPWAIQPVYSTLPCLPPLFYRAFFPHTHAPCLPACASLLTHLHADDAFSTTSAPRVVSPASSLSSSRPASWHFHPHDSAGLSRYGANHNATSSVASASSLLHLNFRVRLEDTNNPQGTGVSTYTLYPTNWHVS